MRVDCRFGSSQCLAIILVHLTKPSQGTVVRARKWERVTESLGCIRQLPSSKGPRQLLCGVCSIHAIATMLCSTMMVVLSMAVVLLVLLLPLVLVPPQPRSFSLLPLLSLGPKQLKWWTGKESLKLFFLSKTRPNWKQAIEKETWFGTWDSLF